MPADGRNQPSARNVVDVGGGLSTAPATVFRRLNCTWGTLGCAAIAAGGESRRAADGKDSRCFGRGSPYWGAVMVVRRGVSGSGLGMTWCSMCSTRDIGLEREGCGWFTGVPVGSIWRRALG